MKATFNQALPHSYYATSIDELPGAGQPVWYFPGAIQEKGRDGLIVQITPQAGSPWIGVFAFGAAEPTGLYACPNTNQLCVVSLCNVYFVNVQNPRDWSMLDLYATDVVQLAKQNLLLIVEPIDIRAFSEDGQAWCTEQLGADIIIDSIDELKIYGSGEVRYDERVEFIIDLKTGKKL